MASAKASLQLLLDFDLAVSKPEFLPVIRAALNFCEARFDCDRISLSLYDEARQGLVIYTRDKSVPSLAEGQLLTASRLEIQALLANTDPLYSPDICRLKNPNSVETLLGRSGYRAGFIIPLLVDKAVVGSLNFDSRTVDGIAAPDREAMVLLSSRLSLALHHAQIHDALVKQEQALKISERDYRDLVEQAGDAILKGAADGRILQVNQAAVRLLGYSEEYLLSMNMAELFSGEILREKPLRYDLLEQGLSVISERTVSHRDGHTIMVEMNSRRLINGNIICIMRDLTERLQSQERLLDREQKLLDAQDMARLGNWEYDFSKDRFSASEKFYQLLKIEAGQLEGSLAKYVALIHPDDRKSFELGLAETTLHNKALDLTHRVLVRDTDLWLTLRARLKTSAANSGAAPVMVGTAQDVTDLHSTQKALRASEARALKQLHLLRSVSDNTPNLVWAEDAQGCFTFVNKEFCRFILQTSSTSEPLGASLEDFVSRSKSKKSENTLLDALAAFKQSDPDSQTLSQIELSGKLAGSMVFLNISRSRIKDFMDKITGTVYNAYDISLQKSQSIELENRGHQIQAFLDAVPAPLYAKDKNGKYVLLNESYLRFFGKNIDDMVGKTVSQCWDEEIARQFEEDDRLLMETNQRQNYHSQLTNAAGDLRNIVVHKARYFDASGEVAGFIGTLWDYTDLQDAEQRYHNLFDYSPIPVVVHDAEHILAANRAALDFYGGGEVNYSSLSVLNLIHPDFHDVAKLRSAEVLKSQRPNQRMHQKFITANGEVRDVEAMAAPVSFENKPAIMVSFRDITEEKLTRERLVTNEENYRNLMEMMPNPVIVHLDGRVLYLNRAALDFAGKDSLADLEGVDLYGFVHPEFRDKARKTLETLIKTGQASPPTEQRYLRGDGQVRDVETRSVPIVYEDKPAVLLSFTDNTERMSARRELQESRLQLEMVTDHVTHYILLVNTDLRILYANRSCAAFLHLEKDALVGMPAEQVIVAPALEKTRTLLAHAKGPEPQGFSYEYEHSDGSLSEYWTTLIPVLAQDGTRIAILAQIEDITEREQARKELAENKELLELIIDTIPALISYADASQRFLFANQAYAEWYGKNKTDIIGTRMIDLLGESRYTEARPLVERVMAGENLYFSQPVSDRNGETHILDGRFIPHLDHQRQVKAFLAVWQDVTEQRQAEIYQDALRHLASSLTRPMSLHDIGKETAIYLRSVFQSDAIAIEVFDDLQQLNRGIYSEDTFINDAEPREIPTADLSYADILPLHHDVNYQPTCVNRTEADLKTRLKTILFGDKRLSRSLLNVPIRWEGQAIGIISVQSYEENKYSERDIPRLQVFGDQIGVAIKRADQDAELLAHQAAIEREEQKYRTLIESAGDAVFVCDLKGRLLIVNDRSVETLGYSQAEFMALNIKDIDPVFYKNTSAKTLKQLEQRNETAIVLSSHTRKDGSQFPVELRVSITEIEAQKCVLIFARDITERKLAESRERALRELAHRLNESKDMATVGRMAAHSIRNFFDSDAFAIEYYDHDHHMILGVYSEDTLKEGGVPEPVEPRDTPFATVRKDFFKLNSSAHVRNRTADELQNIQRSRPFGSGRLSHSLLFAPIVWGDRNIGVLTVQSYTDNKYSDADLGNIQLFADQIGGAMMRARADARLLVQTNALLKSEMELTGLLKEKDILLKEVYHRTKNNMQVIVGLLEMQSYKTDNQQTLDVLHEMTDRISSMSLVHDLLYRSKSLADIRLDAYLEKLATRLITAYQSPSLAIDLNLSAEPIRINIQLAVPLGLVINEVITNALKYAFPHQGNGELMVIAKHWQDVGLDLWIGDNGVGLDVDFDPLSTESLGMKIIRDIVELQLQGELKLDRSKGLLYHIRIPDLALDGKES